MFLVRTEVNSMFYEVDTFLILQFFLLRAYISRASVWSLTIVFFEILY